MSNTNSIVPEIGMVIRFSGNLSVVTLLRREGNILHVSGIDVLDGTSLIDIKPYIPRFDSYPEASAGWTAGKEDRPKPPGRE